VSLDYQVFLQIELEISDDDLECYSILRDLYKLNYTNIEVLLEEELLVKKNNQL
jgi:hypothetical protein